MKNLKINNKALKTLAGTILIAGSISMSNGTLVNGTSESAYYPKAVTNNYNDNANVLFNEKKKDILDMLEELKFRLELLKLKNKAKDKVLFESSKHNKR